MSWCSQEHFSPPHDRPTNRQDRTTHRRQPSPTATNTPPLQRRDRSVYQRQARGFRALHGGESWRPSPPAPFAARYPLPVTRHQDDEKFDAYIARMGRDGEWGGHQELFAASQHYNCNVVVHQVSELHAPKPVHRERATESSISFPTAIPTTRSGSWRHHASRFMRPCRRSRAQRCT